MSANRLVVTWCFFFFNDTATTEIYTLSLHDALPISRRERRRSLRPACRGACPAPGGPARRPRRAHGRRAGRADDGVPRRSEEHTSELQSRPHLVCRLLLEKKNTAPIIALGDVLTCAT